jgi:uronate dehydrogenase
MSLVHRIVRRVRREVSALFAREHVRPAAGPVPPSARLEGPSQVNKILITGAGGNIGTRIRPLLEGAYSVRLSDIHRPNHVTDGDDFVAADLADLAQVEQAVAGVDGILHLGGFSVEGPWETIHSANIVGCYNLFEAARRHGVKRIVFASSNHAVGFYPRNRRISVDDPVRPDSRYGVSKAFGEALGAFYAYKFGLRVTCIRIGHLLDRPVDKRRLSIWISTEDLAQLVRIGFDHPDLRYEIFFGMSDNERAFWDNAAAARYGYRPQSRAEDYAVAVLAAEDRQAPDPVGDWYQGGPFCSDEYDGGEPSKY